LIFQTPKVCLHLEGKKKKTTENEENENIKEKRSGISSIHAVLPYGARFGQIKSRPFSFCIGILIVVYGFYFCYMHDSVTGENFNGIYDVLWLTNLSLGIAAFGMLLQKPQIIGTAVACVAFAHISWFFYVIYWLLFDTFQIGRALYLEEQEFDNLWWTTLHQFWFIPLCLLVLHVDYHSFGIPFKSWIHSVFIFTVMNIYAYINFYSTSVPPSLKLHQYVYDLNTGHEFWLPSHKDSYNVVHLFDDAPILAYTLWRLIIEAGLLNGVCFIFLKIFSALLLEDFAGKVAGKDTKK